MRDWAIGLSTGCFYQKSIFDCLETIGSGGSTSWRSARFLRI